MLVAKRDPFHPGANDVSIPRGAGAPRLARALSALQICGTLLAVPVGLGSAYSMYRANFSVETTCQNLRANIVAMLDRGVDANARHMLVRRDIETFEQSCGAVDPDATAAFKVLLTADRKSPPVVVPVAAPAASAVASPPEAKPDIAIRKIEMRPSIVAKQPAAVPAVAEAKPPQRDAATSDAAWLAAVRGALVKEAALKHDADPALISAAAPIAVPNVPPVVTVQSAAPAPLERRALGEVRSPSPAPAPPMSLAAPIPVSAPALPPATPVATAPAPQADGGHPVPPAAIPDANPADAAKAANRSRIGALIAQIPFVGRAFDR